MRNVLVLPNGEEQDFMYPANRQVGIGDKLQIVMQDESIHIVEITKIEKREQIIYYYLAYHSTN